MVILNNLYHIRRNRSIFRRVRTSPEGQTNRSDKLQLCWNVKNRLSDIFKQQNVKKGYVILNMRCFERQQMYFQFSCTRFQHMLMI